MAAAEEQFTFERFTERAYQVVALAGHEAAALGNSQVGSQHLLLGMLAEEGGLAGLVLRRQGVSLEEVRKISELLDPGHGEAGEVPLLFSPNALTILERALPEANSLGQNYVGTEHLLIATLKFDNVVAEILGRLDVDSDEVIDDLRRLLQSVPSVDIGDDDVPEASSGSDPGDGSNSDIGNSDEVEFFEAIPTHSDRPAKRDDLGRTRLAEVIGERIRRVRGENTEARAGTRRERREKLQRDRKAAREEGSFLVHIHAPWGAGKSSLLRFLGKDMRNRPEPEVRGLRQWLSAFLTWRRADDPRISQWVVVEFSAWEHQRLATPWWWLLAAIQRSCSRELWQIDRGRWLWFWARDIAWRLWNARAAVFTVAVILAAVAFAWADDWFKADVGSLTALQAVLLTVTSVAALASTLFGLAKGAGRWLAVGSAAGADRFLRRARDPLGVYRRRFRWLIRSAGRPVTVFIDDLDRCRPAYVVELLEGIQTLFADEPVTYVVAADRGWLCKSFAEGYREFEDEVGDLGRPLGFHFLEKTFQISMEIPPMSRHDRKRYWDGLLRALAAEEVLDSAVGTPEGLSPDAFAGASTQGQLEQKIELLVAAGEDREKVLVAAVRRANAPDMQEKLEKLLSEFAPLIEANPRSMKRLMNAYGVERDRLLRDNRLLSTEERRQLALLTILRLRWPVLAEHLRRCPEDAEHCLGVPTIPEDHEFAALYADRDLSSLFDGSVVSERLDASLLAEFPPEPERTAA